MNPCIAQIYNIKLAPGQGSQVCDNKNDQFTTTGQSIKKFITRSYPPITINTVIKGVRNKIQFQNLGTTNARIKNWTLLANGGVFEIKAEGDDINLYSDDIIVEFPTDPFNAGGANNVEYLETILSDDNVLNFKL